MIAMGNGMPQNRHCLICSTLIFSGLYCSSCNAEIRRFRTSDDMTFEEWLSLAKTHIPKRETVNSKIKDLYIFESASGEDKRY